MPCQSDNYGCYSETLEELNRVTRLLCELCAFTHKNDLRPELEEWYSNHLKLDAERIKKEKEYEIRKEVTRQALEKLSSEEKKILGLI